METEFSVNTPLEAEKTGQSFQARIKEKLTRKSKMRPRIVLNGITHLTCISKLYQSEDGPSSSLRYGLLISKEGTVSEAMALVLFHLMLVNIGLQFIAGDQSLKVSSNN